MPLAEKVIRDALKAIIAGYLALGSYQSRHSLESIEGRVAAIEQVMMSRGVK